MLSEPAFCFQYWYNGGCVPLTEAGFRSRSPCLIFRGSIWLSLSKTMFFSPWPPASRIPICKTAVLASALLSAHTYCIPLLRAACRSARPHAALAGRILLSQPAFRSLSLCSALSGCIPLTWAAFRLLKPYCGLAAMIYHLLGLPQLEQKLSRVLATGEPSKNI